MAKIHRRLAAAALAGLCATAPALADGFRTVTDRNEFVNLVQGRELTRLGIRLSVSPSGQIAGRAFGSTVRGSWNWSGNYFCRSLYYGDRNLGDNCQMVTVSGTTVRFTADRGEGRSADLYLN